MRQLVNKLLPLILLFTSLALTLYNIKGFPMMVGDEGIYVSQAWWLAKFGQLGPYTYWYDHFPLGWVQIGLWQLAAGSPFAFGTSVMTGRIFMVIVKAVSALFLFFLSKKIFKSTYLATFTALLYTISPLALTFNRLVLLDNIAVMWLIVSLWSLFRLKESSLNLWLSSVALALGILTKESLLFFIPPYLYTVWLFVKDKPHRLFRLLVPMTSIAFLLSLFPLLALLKNEFFPGLDHVSLLTTILFQAERGQGVPFWNLNSDFRQILPVWLQIDPLLILTGAGSLLINFFNWQSISSRIISLYSIFFLIFLLRGGLIYDFYLIPLIPLLILNLTQAISHLFSLTKSKLSIALITTLIVLFTGYSSMYTFTTRATSDQLDSLSKLQTLAQPTTPIVADNYAYLDLALDREGRRNSQIVEWYSKAEEDKKIIEQSFQNNSSNIKFMLVNDTLNSKLNGGDLPFLKSGFDKMIPLYRYGIEAPTTAKPYTYESVTIYGSPSAITQESLSITERIDNHFILKFNGNLPTNEELDFLKSINPWAVIIGFQNITNSTSLEETIRKLKDTLRTNTLLITHQSDSGSVSIPWIGTSLRTSYKSPLEASSATAKKVSQLANYNFTGYIATAGDNSDGYLHAITQNILEAGLSPLYESETEVTEGLNYPILLTKTPSIPLNQSNLYIYEPKNIKSKDDIIDYLGLGLDKLIIDINIYRKLRSELIMFYQTNSNFQNLIKPNY